MAPKPEHKSEHSDSVAYISRERAQNEAVSIDIPDEKAFRDFWREGNGRWVALGFIALLLLIAAVATYRVMSRPAPGGAASTEANIPLVSIVTAGMQPVTSTVSFTGTITARYDMPIGAEGEGGRITAVYVEAGDQVKRGQVLAKLDVSVLTPQLNRLSATLEEARADASLADAEFTRAKGVEGSGALSNEEVERRRAAAVTANARVRVAAAQLAEAQANLARTSIRAPADGVVLTRNAEVGQMAMPGGETPLFRLASGGEIEMRGQVAEQDLPVLTVGQTADVRLTGIAEPFKGTVRLLGAVIDPQTRLGDIRVSLPSSPALRPGAFARGEVTVGNAKRAILPQTAILSDKEGTYVFVVTGENKIERRPIRVSGSVPAGIVVSEGLKGNERVVSTAGSFLREGEKVEVATPKARA
jgi:HlyD family secretion protein